jgi:hypothetical protein
MLIVTIKGKEEEISRFLNNLYIRKKKSNKKKKIKKLYKI